MPRITCKRCHQVAEGFAAPPTKSRLGVEVQASICPACWQQWLAQEVMVINEYRLRLYDRGDRAKLDQAARRFLELEEGEAPRVDFSPPTKS